MTETIQLYKDESIETAINAFFSYCEKYDYKQEDIQIFKKAIKTITPLIKNEKRLCGYPLLTHHLNMATWLVRSKLSCEVITAAILYNLDQFKSIKEVKNDFNSKIITLLRENKVLSRIEKNKERKKNNTYERFLLMSLNDFRALYIKFAAILEDILHPECFTKVKQKKFAKEILEFYSPLAYRLGLEKIRRELEEKAFSVKNPRKFNEIKKFIKFSEKERQENLCKTIESIKEKFSNKIEIVQIKGRVKHIYSMYKKFNRTTANGKIKLDKQKDHTGIRLILNSKKDCYKANELLENIFNPLPGFKKDYITNPKPNGYQSIHNIFITPFDEKLEIQIRTQEMNDHAERGPASHWSYKGINSEISFEKKLSWFQTIFEFGKQEGSNSFLESTRIKLFKDKTFCFTPKGDIVDLPAESTVLDFAFNVHEKLGIHCIGAMAEEHFLNINTVIKPGATLELITHPKQFPKKEWLNFTRCSKAKQAIKTYFKENKNITISNTPIKVRENKHIFTNLIQSPSFPDIPCKLTSCCSPLPGDRIIGINKKNRIIIHSANCHRITNKQDTCLVEWIDNPLSILTMDIIATERSSLLSDILNIYKQNNVKINHVAGEIIDATTAKCTIKFPPQHINRIEILIKILQKIEGFRGIKIY